MSAGADARATISPRRFDAVVFDMDGVVTDTARVHASAWKRMFDEHLRRLAEVSGGEFIEFDIERDYLTYVDGKPRFDGAKSFFASRSIGIPDGEPGDPPEAETVWGLSARKQSYFLDALAEDGADAYPTTLALIEDLRAAGIATAMITASRNSAQVLESAGVGDVFDARVDGVVAAELGLRGKPAPDVFLEAADRLGKDPSRAVVVEDAQAGVAAGRAGGFGLVIGVDRAGQREELLAGGADVVVDDLGEVRVAARESGPPSGPTAMKDLPYAFERMDEIREAVASREPVFFLDYDGTLTPIVERPEDALMPPATRDVLSRLAAAHTVAMISGRDVRFVREQVDLDGVLYAGSHGFDIVGPEGLGTEKLSEFERFLPLVDDAETSLRERLAGVEGATIERKKYSVAAHYRQVADADVHLVTEAVDAVVVEVAGVRKGLGKKVYEVRPDVDWHKGRAVMWLFGALGFESGSAVPFYVGDDVTDEDAFGVLRGIGIGVAVGAADRETLASYRVDDPSDVARFLEAFASERGSARE